MLVSEEIKRLHELHQAGALTDAEFAQAKAKLLNGVGLGSLAGGAGPDLVQRFSRLRRARGDRWLGGVCGGLGQLSGTASWMWRLAFALFSLSFGLGLVIYILLWIFVPEEEIGN